MVIPTDAGSVFNSVVTVHGQLSRCRTFVPAWSGNNYDDAYWTASGSDTWFYGMKQPLDIKTGGEDFKQLSQGHIQLGDSKFFVPGSIDFDSNNKYKLFIGGSPSVTPVFEIIDNGVIPWNISGVDIFKKIYVRLLNNGSFIGEY